MKYDPDAHGTRRCYYLGHVMVDDGNYCDVCRGPYYAIEDGHNWIPRIHWRVWQVRCAYWRFRGWLVRHCDDPYCKRVDRVCGQSVGDHSKCSPVPF